MLVDTCNLIIIYRSKVVSSIMQTNIFKLILEKVDLTVIINILIGYLVSILDKGIHYLLLLLVKRCCEEID